MFNPCFVDVLLEPPPARLREIIAQFHLVFVDVALEHDL